MKNFEYTGRETDGKHRKRKRKAGSRSDSVVSIALCFTALSALSACLVLFIQNRQLQREAREAAAFMENAYTEQEAELIVQQAAERATKQAAEQAALEKEQAVLEKEDEILAEIKRRMEAGEGAAAMLRDFYPDEIVVASEGRYHFFPISDSMKHHAYQKEQFVFNEDHRLEYAEDGQVVSKMGIDVSRYQSDIDWRRVAADGVEYAFIRLGIRGYGEGKLTLDDAYDKNMEGAIANGLDVGVYFFTQALNEEEAIEEAEFVLEHLEGYDVTWPVVLDVEEIASDDARTADMEKQDWTDVCIAFCERIKEAGYTPMIYGNLKTFLLMLDMEQLEEYEKWFAYYQTPLYFPYEFSIWQYTSTGKVDGIEGDVDLNVSMKEWG